jgi:hypothetical protein
VLARKSLAGTVAANVLAHSTGALHVDACRIATTDALGGGAELDVQSDKPEGWDRPWRNDPEAQAAHAARVRANVQKAETLGRWPANVLLDPEAAAMLDAQTGVSVSRRGSPRTGVSGDGWGMTETGAEYSDSGGASRFFYCAKAASKERNAGLEGFAVADARTMDGGHYVSEGRTAPKVGGPRANSHPTVKPIALMRWLVRLVTPPGGLVHRPLRRERHHRASPAALKR